MGYYWRRCGIGTVRYGWNFTLVIDAWIRLRLIKSDRASFSTFRSRTVWKFRWGVAWWILCMDVFVSRRSYELVVSRTSFVCGCGDRDLLMTETCGDLWPWCRWLILSSLCCPAYPHCFFHWSRRQTTSIHRIHQATPHRNFQTVRLRKVENDALSDLINRRRIQASITRVKCQPYLTVPMPQRRQ